jgi:cytochrome bd-type quinol oxidase subunit 2
MGTAIALDAYNLGVATTPGALSMDSLFRILVIGVLIAIVVSLGSALFYLARGHGDSQKMIRALAFRVGLSLVLFVLLMVAWYFGLISPHDVQPASRP